MSLGSGSENPIPGGAKGPVCSPPPGEVIAGKYQVEGLIGAGGMGVVVAARHLQLDKRVAVKLLHPDAASASNASARFLREARAAASLRSEHVAQIMDVDKLPSGAPYMVMEYLSGSSLSKVLRQRAPLPIPEAVDYALQTCAAIAEAHALGIVHRDLKPGNLFLTQRPDGSPLIKVLDFGISKISGPESEEQELTATNVVLGSPQYASPEQLRSLKSTDARTDIWALGVILYYMLGGRRPFEGETLSALFIAISNDTPAPLRNLRPDVPIDLESIVMRCLEKNRERRVQTIETLARALRPFAPASAGARASIASHPDAPAFAPDPPLRQGGSSPMLDAPPIAPVALLLPHHADPEIPTSGTKRVWTAPPAQAKGAPKWLIQVGVAVAALGALALMITQWKKGDAADQAASIESVAVGTAAPAPPPPAPPPAEPPEAPAVDTAAEAPLVVPPPVGFIPTASSDPRWRPVPGLGAGKMAFTRVKIKLGSRAGGGAVVGEIGADEVVLVTEEQGEWVRLSHAGTGQIITGWTQKKALRFRLR